MRATPDASRGAGPRLAIVAALATVLAGCFAPEVTLDDASAEPPAFVPRADLAGPLAFTKLAYDFGVLLVQNPGTQQPYPVRVIGSLHLPEESARPAPVVVFMHGRHGTCKIDPLGFEILGTVTCPDTPATTPVDSFEGYDYMATHLASHGYAVASINANDINDRDLLPDFGAVERGALVLRTLDELRAHNASGGLYAGRLDLARVGLMGHSRGGEGVVAAIHGNDARPQGERHAIRAVFSLAPIDYNRFPATGVHFATLLPYCDGDVRSLSGAWIFDDSRYIEADAGDKIQILAMGANHNFYNTVWTGDDWSQDDPECGRAAPARLTADDQRRHGLVYMTAFLRAYAGGEAGYLPLFAGGHAPPAEACRANATACPGLIHVSLHPESAARLVLDATLDEASLRANALGGETTLDGFTHASVCTPRAASNRPSGAAGFVAGIVTRQGPEDGCPSEPTTSTAPQLALAWNGFARLRTLVPPAHADFTRYAAVTLRLGADPDAGPLADPRVVLEDASGARAEVKVLDHSLALFDPPGGDARKVTLNMARLPLAAFHGIELARVAALELRLEGAGAMRVTDLMLQ